VTDLVFPCEWDREHKAPIIGTGGREMSYASTHQNTTLSLRLLVNNLIVALNINQKVLAYEAEVTQPWLSQVLNGRRRSVETKMMGQVYSALVKLINNNSAPEFDRNKWLLELDDEFQKYKLVIDGEPILQTSDLAKIAADLLAELMGLGLNPDQIEEVAQILCALAEVTNRPSSKGKGLPKARSPSKPREQIPKERENRE
jgi:hypothetical protein